MTDEVQYTDDYFIHLTMPYNQRDDEIYCKWAVWCAKSEDRYYIDGKDGYFFTHVRTDEEILIERKKRQILELLFNQEIPLDEEGHPTEEWMQYDMYINDLLMSDNILEITPLTFEEWKKQNQDESAE